MLCSIKDCDKRASTRGLCRMHYTRLVRTGTTDPGPYAQLPAEQRFWRKVAKGDSRPSYPSSQNATVRPSSPTIIQPRRGFPFVSFFVRT
jgi:hypothetical protein